MDVCTDSWGHLVRDRLLSWESGGERNALNFETELRKSRGAFLVECGNGTDQVRFHVV